MCIVVLLILYPFTFLHASASVGACAGGAGGQAISARAGLMVLRVGPPSWTRSGAHWEVATIGGDLHLSPQLGGTNGWWYSLEAPAERAGRSKGRNQSLSQTGSAEPVVRIACPGSHPRPCFGGTRQRCGTHLCPKCPHWVPLMQCPFLSARVPLKTRV